MLLVVIMLGVLPGLIVGTVFALIPWLALRRRLERPDRLVWASVGVWVLAFAVPLVILLARGVGAAVYGGAGIGVIDPGGPIFAFKVVAAFLAPPIGALLAGVFHWVILHRQVLRPGTIAAITALSWPLAFYGGFAFAALAFDLLQGRFLRGYPLLFIAGAAAVALVLIISRRLIGRVVRTVPEVVPVKQSVVPALLSLGFPGLGQLVEGQWARAAVVWALTAVPWMAWAGKTATFDFERAYTPSTEDVIGLMMESPMWPVLLLITAAAWVWSIVDAYRRSA
ncbi:MAG: hypothetical protein ACT4P5_15245 [Armatimonadota bacterium]